MDKRFCTNCGAQMEENAIFCMNCGKKAAAAAPEQIGSVPASPTYMHEASGSAEPIPPQTGAYQQPPGAAPPQTGAYQQPPMAPPRTGAYQQPPGAAPPQTGAYQQPPMAPLHQTGAYQQPAAGNPYAGYSGSVNNGANNRKKGKNGALIGGIIGLVALAAIIAVVVLVFAKPPAEKTEDNIAGTVPSSDVDEVLENNTDLPAATDNIKNDAVPADIVGVWEGEIQFTRMEGFENLPGEELPPNLDDMINEILANPAPLEFEIEEDGNWDFYADVVMGMWFSSYDYDSDTYETNPLLITELKNGAFDISYEEYIDEGDVSGSAGMQLTGVVFENSEGLYIEGTICVTLQSDGAIVVEEGNYHVSRSYQPSDEPVDSYIESAEPSEPVDPGSATDAGQPTETDFSTSARPDLSDFLWYIDSVYYEGVPANAVPITEFSELTGGWKAFFYYDPENTMDAYGFEYLNAVIGGTEVSVEITLDWYLINFGGYEEYDISDTEDSQLYGSFEFGGITGSGDGYVLYITEFYYLNGRQYGVGYMELQSGEPTYVALVRP
ncbi:MAG: zinc-ribbon domain-containing protein [Clostridiales bacterium]|nr:zinc-ribbon domain-containing protein [Clostridiales bacterium]